MAEVAQYKASDIIQQQLADDVGVKKEEVISTHEVTTSDLNTYKITEDLKTGKANPFSSMELDPEQGATEDGSEDNSNSDGSSNKKSSSGTSKGGSSSKSGTNDNSDDKKSSLK